MDFTGVTNAHGPSHIAVSTVSTVSILSLGREGGR